MHNEDWLNQVGRRELVLTYQVADGGGAAAAARPL
jgi:hypothetical protein